MPNPWIEHVRRYAEQKGVTYACALSDPRVRDGYVSSKGGAPKMAAGAGVPSTTVFIKKKYLKPYVESKKASESALAALGAKELRTLKAADAIIGTSQQDKAEKLLAQLVKKNKALKKAKASELD